MIADSVPAMLPETFEDCVSAIDALPHSEFQRTIFLGVFHENGPVSQLLSGRYDLFETITRVSKTKREWLAFIGLYPPGKDSPLFQGLNLLLRSPGEFQRIAVSLLTMFWEKDFRQTWDTILPQLQKSREEKERLFEACSLEEFLKLALLRVEIDERKGVLKALRGGYSLPLKNLARAILLPSALNDKRHWTTFDADPNQVVAYFPYFDPSISMNLIPASGGKGSEEPEIDPALTLKALGDTTRYAIVSVLAKEPLTSADLAEKMGLSRPTVSHHVHLLREGGLLLEKSQGKTVLLSLRRDAIENLSALIIRNLFESSAKTDLRKTRTR
jgi:DNA-binding transcriptional ArsR family regulator